MDVGDPVIVEVQQGEDGVLRPPPDVDVQAAARRTGDDVEQHARLSHSVLRTAAEIDSQMETELNVLVDSNRGKHSSMFPPRTDNFSRNTKI